MSLETRTNSAFFKRAEQLRRWEESDTNREPPSPKKDTRKVKFSSGCVFLAACAAGDKDEVLKLLEKGADINTANVDGLTALHQACIDDNLDMVEFLVDQGADVNRGDNEGWTPLHATASCGFLYIAKYLIERGASVAAVNNDGELPIDIAECSKMENFLRDEIQKRGIDCDAARNDEEIAMLRDAKEWLATKSSLVNEAHAKTGATPLHVAAAKGYLDVMKILLQCNADIDSQDVDGWSPLHAAAHWGQEEACRVLVENLADMDSKNYVGQTPFDLADSDMLSVLEDLKKKQNKEDVNKRKAKKRQEAENRSIDAEAENQQVKKVKMEIKEGATDIVAAKNNENIEMDVSSESEASESESESEETESSSEVEDEKKNRTNAQPISEKIPTKEPDSPAKLPPIPPKPTVVVDTEDTTPSWRKSISKPSSPEKKEATIKDFKANPSDITNENEVTLRRTKSFQNDEQFYARYKALHARIQQFNESGVIALHNTSIRPKSDIILTNAQQHYRSVNDEKAKTEVSSSATNTTSSPTRTTQSLPTPTSPQTQQNNQPAFRRGLKLALDKTPPVSTTASNGSATPTSTTPTTPGGTRLQMFKNFFKSFVPPVRDEESETQRKAHAKKVRETRRSTQGVTLEEIKSAEQLVKMKNQPNNNNNNNNEAPGTNGDSSNIAVSVTATITTGTPTVLTRSQESLASKEPPEGADAQPNLASLHERRPSWRLKVDGSSKFKLEDASKPEPPHTPSYIRRLNSTTTTTTTGSSTRPASAPPIDTAETTTITLPLRRPKSLEDREQENKENDARNAQATLATQAAIQRRRRPKRRSTGVVNFENPDELDQEKDPAAGGDNDSSQINNQEAGD